MKKFIVLIILATLSFAKTEDSDLDGVPNNLDLCPNTPLLETVDKNGCSKSQKKIKYQHEEGYEYDSYKEFKNSKLIFASLSGKKENLKLKLFSSLLDNGMNSYHLNSLIAALYYYKDLNSFSLKAGFKTYFETFYNKKLDYAILIQGIYNFKNFDIGISEQHKFYGEDYFYEKDTITLFFDYYYKKFTISPYFYTENSLYKKSKWYKYEGITIFYSLNKKIGFSIDYLIDSKKSQHTIDGSVIYNF